jgi:oxygen-dependent protoporphyrinogen oxidase
MITSDRAVRVVIVGGGLSGLACAFKLAQSNAYKDGGIKITLLEASDRVGGIIKTNNLDDCLIECGPDSFITNKPYLLNLASALGLSDQIIATNEKGRGAMVVSRGKLCKLPEGFNLVAPSLILPFLESPILSIAGRLRALAEPFVPVRLKASGPVKSGDESLASFVRRRFGRELYERIAQPMVGGIYVGDGDKLSAAMTVERFVALEQNQGSVIGGLISQARASKAGDETTENSQSGVRYGLFCSFKEGMQTLPDRLCQRLIESGIEIVYGAKVQRVSPVSGSWKVFGHNPDHFELDADRLVLALPAGRAAALLPEDALLPKLLAGIDAASSVGVGLIFDKADLPSFDGIDAFGVVIPEVEQLKHKLNALAISFASKKFVGRAPDKKVVLRVFLGGAKNAGLNDLDDQALVDMALSDLQKLLSLAPSKRPGQSIVSKWPAAMPQFYVGHKDLLAQIDEALLEFDGLGLAGASYRGVGLPECVNSGEICAESILQICFDSATIR